MIGDSSEDFLEASKALTAAKNRGDLKPAQFAKLKYVLFYMIKFDLMDNYDIRRIYQAQGGDPRRRGRKPRENRQALQELLDSFPETEEIEESLAEQPQTETPAKKKADKPTAVDDKSDDKPSAKGKPKPKRGVDKPKAEAATERFKRRTDTNTRPLRTNAEGALADLDSLEKALSHPARISAMTTAARAA